MNMRTFKVIVEKHPDGYVAYPLGLKGVVVGEGNTYEEAMSDVKSAICFHSVSSMTLINSVGFITCIQIISSYELHFIQLSYHTHAL